MILKTEKDPKKYVVTKEVEGGFECDVVLGMKMVSSEIGQEPCDLIRMGTLMACTREDHLSIIIPLNRDSEDLDVICDSCKNRAIQFATQG